MQEKSSHEAFFPVAERVEEVLGTNHEEYAPWQLNAGV